MITSLYAGILGILFFKISIDTISVRRKNQISLGAGSENQILGLTSAHSNFTSYAIYLLLLLYLVEVNSDIPSVFIHFIAIIFTVCRILHFIALSQEKMNFTFRKMGMHMTLWPLLALSIINIYFFAVS